MVLVFTVLFYTCNLLLLSGLWYAWRAGKKESFYKTAVLLYAGVVLFLIGCRPIGENGFADTGMYADWFVAAKANQYPSVWKDVGYDLYNWGCSYLFSLRGYFIFTAAVCTLLLCLTGGLLTKSGWYLFLAFFLLLDISYGILVVLMRNGMAILIFIFALTVTNRYQKMIFLLLAVAFHKSMLIPVLIYTLVLITRFRIQNALIIWMLAFPFLFLFGEFWLQLLGDLHIDPRLQYLTEDNSRSWYFHQSGFRWDFVLFSATVIFFSVYWAKFKIPYSRRYREILTAFILTNAFWITIMYANHTFRFFLLSWAFIPLLLALPFLENFTWSWRNVKHVLWILTVLCVFSTLMAVKRLLDL